MAATIFCIFVAELGTMWFIEGRHTGWLSTEFLFDAASLVIIVAPLIYLLLYLPMVRNIHQRAKAEKELLEARDELELRVEQRTAELADSNRRLRQEAEDRRRADEQSRFRSDLLDNVEQAVVATDIQGRILYWNRSSERLYGWSWSEVEGRLLTDLIPNTTGRDVAQDVCLQLDAGQEWRGEVDLRRKDGELFPAHVACFPVLDPDRRPRGIVHLSTDITGRRDVATELEYSEKKYSTLVENSPTGIFIARDGKVVFVNPKLEEITGYAREELVDADWAQFVHEDDRPRLLAIAQKIEAGESTPSWLRCRILTRHGKIRWVDVRSTTISYRGALSVIGSILDVTEAKEAEGALQRSQEMLRRLSSRLLTAQEDERRRVARDLHDGIGQSLSAVKFAFERALGNGEHGGVPQTTAPDLRTVIPGILKDAMEEVRRISMALRPSTLDDLGLLATLRWWSRELHEAHPELVVESFLELEESEVPEPLKIVLFRISQEATSNAVKHSRASRLGLAVRRAGEGLELVVEDDGVGFDPGAVDKPGLSGGLGLSTMRERAELSGGEFTLESAFGRGTTVRVVWPLSS